MRNQKGYRILSRHQGTPTEAIGICIRWRNAEGGLKDKQLGDFILTMGFKGHGNNKIFSH